MAVSRVTLKDIARETGFSVNTVSRALRGDPMLSEQTRRKIQEGARRMGYIKNNFASSLRSGSSHLIAVVINDICNPHYTYIINDIQHSFRSYGYDVLILSSAKEGDENQSGGHFIDLAITQSVDGILLFPYQHDHASVSSLEQSGIPYVLVDREIEEVHADVVSCDDYEGGRLAAQHFLQQGHRRFLYIKGPAYSSSQTFREKGYVDALLQGGVSNEDIHCISDGMIYHPYTENCLSDYIRNEKITAALVFRDEVAYLMINQLRQGGLRIPEDLSVIGFDHLHGFFPYLQPLTSIFCPEEYSLGRTAAQMLLAKIQDPSRETSKCIFPVTIFDEGTTRPAGTEQRDFSL